MKKIIRNIVGIIAVGLFWTVGSIAWVIALTFDAIYMLSRTIRYGAFKVLFKMVKGENPLGCWGTKWNNTVNEAKHYDQEMVCKLEKLRVV